MLNKSEKTEAAASNEKVDELPDSALEKVAGGGDPNCQSADWSAERETQPHEDFSK